MDAARRSLRAARLLQLPAARRPLGRHAPLTSSRVPFAAPSCSATPWTPRDAHFESSTLCCLQLFGDLSEPARRSIRAACSLKPRAAWRPLDAAPLISSRASFAASRCSASPWTPSAAHFESRALCSLELHNDLWTPRAAHFEQRALYSIELLGAPLDATRRSLRAARSVQLIAAR